MFDRACRPLGVATAVALVFASPVMAQQISAKTAWDDLRGAAYENGVVIASGGITDYGTSLVATDVRITMLDQPRAGSLSMDELRIEPRDAHVALIPAEQMSLVATLGSGEERIFDIRHDGEILYRVTSDEIDFGLDFETFDIRMIRSTRRGRPLDEALELTLGGLSSDLHVERAGTVSFTLNAERLGYALALDQQAGGATMRTEGGATIEDVRITFDAEEMDALAGGDAVLARAFDAGFLARLSMITGPSQGESVQTMDGQEMRFWQSALSSEMTVELIDGAFGLTTNTGAGQLRGGMGPLQGDVSFGGATMELRLPLVATDEDQPIRMALTLDALAPTAETLAMFGAQDFAGESVSLALALGADGRLIEELGEDFGEGDTPPVDLSSVRLEDLTLSVGDARLTGNGAFVFLGGLASSLQADRPNGTGDFVFDLIGGDTLLTRLAASGLIPPDQQFFARMMMNGLGRPVGEDHLRSEVSIRPGGAVTVNGAPLPF